MLSVNLMNVLLAASPSMLIVMLLATVLVAVLRNNRQEKAAAAEIVAASQAPVEVTAPASPLMQSITDKMESEKLYLKKGFKLDDMAQLCHTNRTYISNCINQSTGLNFANYVNSYRVKFAQDLMTNKNAGVTLSQIGQMSGFSDEVSFIRNFKKFAGMTPREWVSSQN